MLLTLKYLYLALTRPYLLIFCTERSPGRFASTRLNAPSMQAYRAMLARSIYLDGELAILHFVQGRIHVSAMAARAKLCSPLPRTRLVPPSALPCPTKSPLPHYRHPPRVAALQLTPTLPQRFVQNYDSDTGTFAAISVSRPRSPWLGDIAKKGAGEDSLVISVAVNIARIWPCPCINHHST